MPGSNKRKTTVTCQYCRQIFLPWRNKPGRFCSRQCHRAGVIAERATRFWRRVHKTDTCWLWTGPPATDGYGKFHLPPETRAHRAAWVLTYAPIPAGLVVMHHCDTPLCVRPDHLFLGTNADNSADMRMNQRQARGERNAFSRFTEADIRAIRVARLNGVRSAVLASQYGTSRQYIMRIALRRSWGHVA